MSRIVSSRNAVPRASRHSSAASGTGPKRARARARASDSVMPPSMSFCASRSRWKANSSSSSRSTRRGANNARTRRRQSRRLIGSSQLHHAADGRRHALPLARFDGQLPAPRSGELVVLGSPAEFGDGPLRFNPAPVLEPVEGGIQRALADLQHILGNLLDALRDRPAMLRPGLERPQDQQVERAGQQVGCRSGEALVSIDDTNGVNVPPGSARALPAVSSAG